MLDIQEITAMAEADIMNMIIQHYHTIVNKTKELSPPTVTAPHLKEKIQLSEQYITKHQTDLLQKRKK